LNRDPLGSQFLNDLAEALGRLDLAGVPAAESSCGICQSLAGYPEWLGKPRSHRR
jgi:hypothetical protein